MFDESDMTEFSSNGMGEEDKLPRLDAARKVFITSEGLEIRLTGKRINPLIVQQIQQQGKPAVPKIEVLLAGKYRQIEDNPTDPNYLEALKNWEATASINTGKYLFNVGVAGKPDENWLEENAEFIPDATATELKYMWVASLIPVTEDITALIEAIMGFAVPSEKGLAQTAANFRG